MNVRLCNVPYHSTVVAWLNSMLWLCAVDCKLWGMVMTGWLSCACHLFSSGGDAFAVVCISVYVSVTSPFDVVLVITSSIPERFRLRWMFRRLFSCPGSPGTTVDVGEWLLEGSGWRWLHNPEPGSELSRGAQSSGRPPVNVSARQREGQRDRHHRDREEEEEEG